MEVRVKSLSPPTIYMVDTNIFRYRAYTIGNLKSDTEKSRQRHKLNTRVFWDKAITETAGKKALILTSEETKQELKVQSHTLQKESKTFNNMLKKTLIETTEVPLTLEYLLRDFSNYVRGKYPGSLVNKSQKTNYLQTADARIFIHAYLNDAILVTANIKDFFLYPLFYEMNEDKVLYDISSGQYINFLPTGRKLLELDPAFIKINEEMKNFKA